MNFYEYISKTLMLYAEKEKYTPSEFKEKFDKISKEYFDGFADFKDVGLSNAKTFYMSEGESCNDAKNILLS